MGDDFHSHHIRCSGLDRRAFRAALIDHLISELQATGYVGCPADAAPTRSFAVGPAAEWVTLVDSSENEGEPPDLEPFRALSPRLASLSPVIDVEISDTAIIYLTLFEPAQSPDRFANGRFPYYTFSSPTEAAPFRGTFNRWAQYAVRPDALAQVLDQTASVREILSATSVAFNISEELLGAAYFIGYEGLSVHYSEHLVGSDVLLTDFADLHFKRAAAQQGVEPDVE